MPPAFIISHCIALQSGGPALAWVMRDSAGAVPPGLGESRPGLDVVGMVCAAFGSISLVRSLLHFSIWRLFVSDRRGTVAELHQHCQWHPRGLGDECFVLHRLGAWARSQADRGADAVACHGVGEDRWWPAGHPRDLRREVALALVGVNGQSRARNLGAARGALRGFRQVDRPDPHRCGQDVPLRQVRQRCRHRLHICGRSGWHVSHQSGSAVAVRAAGESRRACPDIREIRVRRGHCSGAFGVDPHLPEGQRRVHICRTRKNASPRRARSGSSGPASCRGACPRRSSCRGCQHR